MSSVYTHYYQGWLNNYKKWHAEIFYLHYNLVFVALTTLEPPLLLESFGQHSFEHFSHIFWLIYLGLTMAESGVSVQSYLIQGWYSQIRFSLRRPDQRHPNQVFSQDLHLYFLSVSAHVTEKKCVLSESNCQNQIMLYW